ncbi:MAG: 3-deoxy-D-manno-octulosonic acid transferase, partial [Gammaproteobacteria bacterium]
VAALCAEQGFAVARFSRHDPCDADTAIYLVDVMGELPRFYAAADVAFVGGSLLPFGGHNVLEPASLGTPVLSGPHTHNFDEICALLSAAGALVVVADSAALVHAAGCWLRDSNERDRVGRVAEDVVRAHRGATARTLELIRARLPAPGA